LDRRRLLSYAVYFLPLTAVAVFILVPVLSVISEGMISGSGSLTFRELADIFRDGRSGDILLFTIKQATVSTAATLLMAIPGAYLVTRYSFPGRTALLSLTTVPFILPPLVLAIGFFTLFGTSGHINDLIIHMETMTGADLPSLDILYSIEGIVLAHVFLNFPVALRIIQSRYENLDPDLERASRSLGAGPVPTFLKVTLPQLKYALIAASSLVFTFCFLSFGVILVVGGGANQTLETEIYRQFSGNLDFSKAGALLFVETMVVVLTTGLYVWASGRSGEDSGFTSSGYGRIRGTGSRPILIAFSILYGLLIAMVILGPMISVIWESFTSDGSFSLHWFDQVISRQVDASMGISPLDAVLNSLIFAFLCSLISVPVSIGVGYLLHKKGGPVKLPLDTLMLMPLGISAVGLGYGMIKVYSGTSTDRTGTWYIIVILLVLLSYPFGARAIQAGLSTIPDRLRKASRSLGAGPLRTFFSVDLPLLAPSIVVAALFSFAISIGEFGATLMVSANSSYMTMPVALYRFLGSGKQYGAATAYAAMMIAITFLCFFMIEVSGRRIYRRRSGR
jgi:thiamine transport system permease protein